MYNSSSSPNAELRLIQRCREGDLAGVIEVSRIPGVDLNFCNALGMSPLIVACHNGRAPVVQYLLDNPVVDVNLVAGHHLFTALHHAAQEGHPEVVRLLLACPRFGRENSKDIDGCTALWTACMRGHTEVVRVLGAHARVLVNEGNANQASPLYIACQGGALEIVRLLLADPRVDANKPRMDSASPLYIACQNGHVAVVQLLLDTPAVLVNERVVEGATPFFIACQKGNLEILQIFLLDPRTNLNIPMRDGTSPLGVILGFGHLEALQLLLASGRPVGLDSMVILAEAKGLDLLPTWMNLLESTGKAEISLHDIAMARGIPACQDLFVDYVADPVAAKSQLWALPAVRRHLQPATELMSLVVFFCDGLLQLTAGEGDSEQAAARLEGARRFFRIAAKIPLEMQATLCHRTYGLAREMVPARELDTMLKVVTRKIVLSEGLE